MEKKKITRKISSKVPVKAAEEKVEQDVAEIDSGEGFGGLKEGIGVKTKKVCFFCQNKSNPAYTDLVTLRRFLTDRAKILAKARSNVCSKHQRGVAKNIKYARHLGLLPFVPKV